jgi:hypothetical protein
MASSKNSLSKSAISNHDDDFRAFSDSIDFFRKRDRVRPVDLKEVCLLLKSVFKQSFLVVFEAQV